MNEGRGCALCLPEWATTRDRLENNHIVLLIAEVANAKI